MERKARNSRDSIRKAQQGMRIWGWVHVHIIVSGLVIGALFIAPSWRTVAAIGLILAAFALEILIPTRQRGPYGGVVAGVVVTHGLFLEDLQGRTRAWLGVENRYGDEKGARLVFYDANGQARLSLRDVEEVFEDADEEGREAEVIRQEDDAGSTEPTLLMFEKDGKVIWRAP